jgi:GAF domain-containing protein
MLSIGRRQMRRGESKAKGIKQGDRPRSAAKVKTRAGRKNSSSAKDASSSLASQLATKTRELNEALRQQAATADVLRVISRSIFDLQSVLNTLVESAARLCEADRAGINRASGTVFEPLAVWGFPPEYISYRQYHPIPLGRGSAAGRAVVEHRTVHIPDLLADPDFERKPEAKAIGLRTMLAVPLMREGAGIGILTLHRNAMRPFTKRQIELAEAFADQAVIAIENTRLFAEVQARTKELTESLEQQTATSEVLKVISSSPGALEPVFNAMLENATRICDARFGTLFRFDGEFFHRVAGTGTPSELVEFQLQRGPFKPENASSSLAQIVATKTIVHVADGRENEGPHFKLGGARSLVAVPMLKDGQLIGAIVIYRQEVRPFSDKQIELVSNFATQAVIAIENARLLSELRQRTR